MNGASMSAAPARCGRRPEGGRAARAFGAAAAMLALPAAAGCAGDTADRASSAAVSDSAGVRIIENTAPDRPLTDGPVKLADLMTPDSALTAVPWGVAADPEAGRIYVVDWTGERVAVFDRSGAYVGTYGRRGGGPGEFRNPSALSVGPDGELIVWDAGRGVLSRWSPGGELAGEERAPVAYWGPGFHERRDTITTVTVRESGREMRQMLVEVVNGDTAVLHSVPRELVTVELPCLSQPMPRVFAPDIVWTADHEALYVLDGPEYRIDVHRGGSLASSVRLDVEPLRVTEGMAVEWARLRYGRLMQRCGVAPEAFVAELGYEERASPIQWIAVDPGGRIWVTRSRSGLVPEHVDIFDVDGVYRGTMDAPGMPVAFVSPSRFVALTIRPQTGRTVLTLYELRARDDRAAGAEHETPPGATAMRTRPTSRPADAAATAATAR